jgi:hypothetical protein
MYTGMHIHTCPHMCSSLGFCEGFGLMKAMTTVMKLTMDAWPQLLYFPLKILLILQELL